VTFIAQLNNKSIRSAAELYLKNSFGDRISVFSQRKNSGYPAVFAFNE